LKKDSKTAPTKTASEQDVNPGNRKLLNWYKFDNHVTEQSFGVMML
jgi:hypothetical protein